MYEAKHRFEDRLSAEARLVELTYNDKRLTELNIARVLLDDDARDAERNRGLVPSYLADRQQQARQAVSDRRQLVDDLRSRNLEGGGNESTLGLLVTAADAETVASTNHYSSAQEALEQAALVARQTYEAAQSAPPIN